MINTWKDHRLKSKMTKETLNTILNQTCQELKTLYGQQIDSLVSEVPSSEQQDFLKVLQWLLAQSEEEFQPVEWVYSHILAIPLLVENHKVGFFLQNLHLESQCRNHLAWQTPKSLYLFSLLTHEIVHD